MSGRQDLVITAPQGIPLPPDVEKPPFVPGIPSPKQLAGLRRGDIIVARNRHRETEPTKVYLIHHIARVKGNVKLYGFDLAKMLDLESKSGQSRHDLAEIWLEPNPQVAMSHVKKILDSILTSLDALTVPLSTIVLDEDDEIWLKPTDGAIRTVLLHGCPFDCEEGFQSRSKKAAFMSNFSEYLGILSSEARALFEERMSGERRLGVLCPGCLGYELAMEDLEREGAECKEHEAQGMEAVRARLSKFEQKGIMQTDFIWPARSHFRAEAGSYDEYCQYGAPIEWQHKLKLFLHSPELELRTQTWIFATDVVMQQMGYAGFSLISNLDGSTRWFDFFSVWYEQDKFEKEKRKAMIDSLPTGTQDFWLKAKERIAENDCGICKIAYQAEDRIVGLSCCHFFHKTCLAPWLRSQMECPTCRKKVPRPGQASEGDGDEAGQVEEVEEVEEVKEAHV